MRNGSCITATVTKIVSDLYTVSSEKGTFRAKARGRFRLKGQSVCVGDIVKVVSEKGFMVIDEVLPRRNSLLRPFVSNIDSALIVVAKEPVPDMILADKIIVNCFIEGIKPVLVYNKRELAAGGEIEKLFSAYDSFIDCIAVSALEKSGFEELRREIEGKTVCLAGQSAVGKTSLMNAILDAGLKTDGLSKKIKRGKNTTRHVEIYEAWGGKIMDTCGFSMLTLVNLEPDELKYYYEDFLPLAGECRFSACSHVNEPDCAVKKAVDEGRVDKARYLRYLEIYNELKNGRRKSYD